MRVMYFAFEGFDNPNGTNHLAIKLIDFLLIQGMDVYLVSSHTKGINPDIPEILRNRQGFSFDIINRRNVDKSNFLLRYIFGFKYAIDCKKRWRKEIKNVDVIILQSTPTIYFSSLLLKLSFKRAVIFNSFDVFPDVAFDSGVLNSKIIYKTLLMMQKFVYKSSSKIVVISSDMRRTLVKHGVDSSKIVEIHNWYDQDNVRYIDRENNLFIQKYNIPKENFYVQYAGNIGFTFDFNYVLNVASLLKDYKKFRFQIVGDGAFLEQFVQEADARGLSNIDFYPWQPIEIISDVYSACDISLIPLSKGVIYNSFPSKGSLLMACGKVILCATEDDSDYCKIINKNKIGMCVSNRTPELAAKAIIELSENPKELNLIGNNAKLFGEKHYSSSINLVKYKQIIEELSGVAYGG